MHRCDDVISSPITSIKDNLRRGESGIVQTKSWGEVLLASEGSLFSYIKAEFESIVIGDGSCVERELMYGGGEERVKSSYEAECSG